MRCSFDSILWFSCKVAFFVTYALALTTYILNVYVGYGKADYWRELNQRPKGNPGIALLREEWEQPFFVDIISIDADDLCPETHPESFLYDVWPGTVEACDCGYISGQY